MACEVEGCNHFAGYFDGTCCACHLRIEDFQVMSKEDREEATRIAALENDLFDVDGEGNITLREP